jgi:hypothetical protein
VRKGVGDDNGGDDDDDDDNNNNNKSLFQQSAILAVQVTVADISVFPASSEGSFSAID